MGFNLKSHELLTRESTLKPDSEFSPPARKVRDDIFQYKTVFFYTENLLCSVTMLVVI